MDSINRRNFASSEADSLGLPPLDATLVEKHAMPIAYNTRLAEFARAPVSAPAEGTTRLAVLTIFQGGGKQVVDVSNPAVLARQTDRYQAGMALAMKVYEVPTDDLKSYVPGGSPKMLAVEPASPAEVLLKKVDLGQRLKEHLSSVVTMLIASPSSVPETIVEGARDMKHAWQTNRKIARNQSLGG